MSTPTMKDLLGKVEGRFDVPAANSEIGSQELAEYRRRLSPATVAKVLDCLEEDRIAFDTLEQSLQGQPGMPELPKAWKAVLTRTLKGRYLAASRCLALLNAQPTKE